MSPVDVMPCGCRWRRSLAFGDVLTPCAGHAQRTLEAPAASKADARTTKKVLRAARELGLRTVVARGRT